MSGVCIEWFLGGSPPPDPSPRSSPEMGFEIDKFEVVSWNIKTKLLRD